MYKMSGNVITAEKKNESEYDGYYFTQSDREVLSEEVASELRSEGRKDWTPLGPGEQHDSLWEKQRQ